MRQGLPPWQESILIARLSLRNAAQLATRRAWSIARWFIDYRLKTAPQIDNVIPDIRPADAAIADQIYSGVFAMAGRVLHVEGGTPFLHRMPTPAFGRELHSFSWLRHLNAAATPLASANARALFGQWADVQGRLDPSMVWDDEVATRRLMAFLQHSTLLLRGGDAQFFRRFLKVVARHVRIVRANVETMRPDAVRLRAHIAIACARLALPTGEGALERALKRLGASLDLSVLADGGHVSRNPETQIEILSDLVPLRAVLVAEGVETPARIVAAMDRMFTALRFFRHADGEPALFNGVGVVLPDRISAVLKHDDTGAAAPKQLPQSGFQRLVAGGTIILADTGRVPESGANDSAHAGTLSFEMSSGRHRYVVNAGVDLIGPDAFRKISRQTSAHSTLVLDERSSAVFTGNPRLERLNGAALLRGPRNVEVSRIDAAGIQGFRASHDGYADAHGLLHEREITLSADGSLINGIDRLLPSSRSEGDAGEATIRFHLHPEIHVIVDAEGRMMLMADGDDTWTFDNDSVPPRLIETFFFARVTGAQKSKAIELSLPFPAPKEVKWRFSRTGVASRIG
jgi:uncharacterized heparinase superfamily protein